MVLLGHTLRQASPAYPRQFGRSISVLPTIGQHRIFLALVLVILAAFALPDAAEATTTFNEIRQLLASDAQAADLFGVKVAVSGETAIVGKSQADAPGSNGAAYVFQRDAGGPDNWGEVRKLIASDGQADDSFGWRVAVDGDTAIVGAYLEDAGGNQAGAAYVFQRNQGGADNWGEVKKLTASDAQQGDYFGIGVAVSGDTTVVGAVWEDAAGSTAGAAYVFQRDEGGADNWGEVKKLTASDAQADSSFGESVAVDGDTTVVGAWLEDSEGMNAGAAYVFQRDQGGVENWGEVKKLTASDAQAMDWFGATVAVSGDTAVVGAYSEDGTTTDAGAVYVFQRNQGSPDNWGEVKKITASDTQTDDRLGISVSISGDTAVAGAYREDDGGTNAGAAYVFQRNQGGTENWGEVNKLTASDAQADDIFGLGVSLSGEIVVVGAPREDAFGESSGAAYVFHLQEPKATPTLTPTPPPAVGGIAIEGDAGLRSLEMRESSSRSFGALSWSIAAAAGTVALASATWWARRRRAS